RLCRRIIFGVADEHSDAANLCRLLRTCRERPRSCRAAEQRDELAPFHQQFLPCFPNERNSMPRAAAMPDFRPLYVRFGSGADKGTLRGYVRFTPVSHPQRSPVARKHTCPCFSRFSGLFTLYSDATRCHERRSTRFLGASWMGKFHAAEVGC